MKIGELVLKAEVTDLITDLQESVSITHHKLVFADIIPMEKDIMVTCPFHGNGRESNPSMGINKEKGLYNCLACGARGTFLGLVQKLMEFESTDRAIEWLKHRSDMNIESQGVVELFVLPDVDIEAHKRGWLSSRFDELARTYLETRGISIETRRMQDYGIHTRDNKDLCIPVLDLQGYIAYTKRRNMFTKEFRNDKGVDKSQFLFGAFQALKRPKPTLWVCESEIDALSIVSLGEHGAVAFGGAYPSLAQLRIIEKYIQPEFIFNGFDNDEPGRKGWDLVQKHFAYSPIGLVDVKYPEGCKDVNDILVQDKWDEVEYEQWERGKLI